MIARRMDKLLLSLMYTRSKRLTNDADETTHDTRSKRKVIFPMCKKVTRFYKRSPYYRGVTLWDVLPAWLQRATSKVKFKRDLDKIKDFRALLKKGYN